MARLTSYAEYYGAIFPAENLVGAGTVYGPTGVEYTGSASLTSPTVDPTDLRGLYANSWQYAQGVEDAGYEFSAQRVFSGTAPGAPASGVKVLCSNPTTRQQVAASTVGVSIQGADKTIVIWAATLSATYAFEPRDGDVVILGEDRWIIRQVTSAVYGSQFVCYCQASPRNVY